METALFTLGRKFSEVCKQYENRITLQVHLSKDRYNQYRYQDLWQLALSVGGWLVSQDVKKQDRVAIILDNSFQWVGIYFGIMLSGAVAVPLDPQMSRETVSNILQDCQAKVVFAGEKFIPMLNRISSSVISLKRIICVGWEKEECPSGALSERYIDFKNVLSQAKAEVSFPAIELDELASILYTSGTTAVPKGVELSHRNFSANFISIQKINLCSEKDNFISILPFFHAYAFMATLLLPLFVGARISMPSSMRSEGLLECMRTSGVTILVGVPELFYNLHRAISEKINGLPAVKRSLLQGCLGISAYLRKFSKANLAKLVLKDVHHKFGNQLRYMVSGGARLEPKIAHDLSIWGFNILEGYGLTETAPIVTVNPLHKPKIGSVGRTIDGVEIKIVEPDKDGIGEVAIRGQNVTKGYYNLPEETRKVIKGGWFYSGDLGYLDKEGYLFLTGRSKEMIVLSSGKNIYPEEIEEYYCQSKFIQEMCVVGVSQATNVMLKAIVVPRLGYFQEKALGDIEGKIKWDLENYSKQLPSYKRIMGFMLTKEPLPRTRLGKIRRYEVEEKYRRQLMGKKEEYGQYTPALEETQILNSEIGRKVVGYLSKELSLRRQLRLDDHLELDLGVDSLARVDLIVGLEEIFQVSLSDTFLVEIQTLKDLIEKIEEVVFRKYSGTPVEKTLPWVDILNRQPKKEMRDSLQTRPGVINGLLTLVVTKLLLMVFKLVFRLEISGREFIPQKGPYIFCCNHASYLDAFAVVASVPFAVELNLYFIGARQIFRHKSIRWAIRLARLIPIDPAVELLPAMEVSGYLLRQGKILCIFPEGKRSIDGKVDEFKKGVGILAQELKVPLVPVAIVGSYQAWGRTDKFPQPHPIKIRFGQPIDYKEFTKYPLDNRIDKYGFISDKIRAKVIELLEA